MEEFTEEEAKDKLEELGFEVVSVDDFEFVGYGVEQLDNENWAVMELHRFIGGDGRLTRMNLSGWLDSPWEAYGWLGAYMSDHPWPVA